MGKLRSFYVTFNDNKEVYYPGETLYGTVVIDLNASMEARAVALKFHGKAYVRWTEHHGSGKNRRTVHYTARENYFEHTISVFGKGSGAVSIQGKSLSSGQTVFPFQFQLPGNLPTSFEGRHGHVRYYIKATIDKPWKFDHNTKRAFSVLDTVDLNQDPNARLPSTANDSKTLCCLCCASGPIQAEVHLDRYGYVAGEFMLINASVDNASDSNMPSTSATLVQRITYRTTRKSKTVKESLATVNGQGCGKRQSIQWNNERLQIPAIPPSMLRFCNIIDIAYSVEFCVVVPGGSINLRVDAPVQIGSIPLQGLTPYNLPPAVVEPSAPPQAILQPPTLYNAPPPSYSACVSGAVDIKDDDDNEHMMGQTSFAPQYAYYDWSQSAFTYTNPAK